MSNKEKQDIVHQSGGRDIPSDKRILFPEDAEALLSELIIGKRPDFSRRVLFLDFDGPVNLGGHYEPPEGETRHVVHKWRGIPRTGEWKDFICNTIHISYYREVADMLRDMNCLWITSWKDLTQSKLNGMMDFDFGYVDWNYRGTSDWGEHGKSLAIGQIVRATGCDWLVVDDQIGEDLRKWIEQESGKPGEVIPADFELGLSLEEMAKIRELML